MFEQKFIISEELLASKWKRFFNHILDLLPQYAIMYGVSYLFFYIGEFTGNYTLNDFWNGMSAIEDYIFTYSLFIIYYFVMESLTHRTLGKYVTNTMVVLENGDKPSNKIIFTRTLCRLIPFDGLSFLGTNGKGWHDSLSKTYVVDVEKFEAKYNAVTEIEEIGKIPLEM